MQSLMPIINGLDRQQITFSSLDATIVTKIFGLLAFIAYKNWF